MINIKPLGDRILVRLKREEEFQVGKEKLVLVHSDKKRFQAESAVFTVVATGPGVPEDLQPGDQVLARSDAGITLPAGTVNADNYRLFRLMEYPEVWSRVEEDSVIATAEQALPERVVI